MHTGFEVLPATMAIGQPDLGIAYAQVAPLVTAVWTFIECGDVDRGMKVLSRAVNLIESAGCPVMRKVVLERVNEAEPALSIPDGYERFYPSQPEDLQNGDQFLAVSEHGSDWQPVELSTWSNRAKWGEIAFCRPRDKSNADLPVPPDRLSELLHEANELLRSASHIAERAGENINWEAFRKQVKKALEEQHPVGNALEWWVKKDVRSAVLNEGGPVDISPIPCPLEGETLAELIVRDMMSDSTGCYIGDSLSLDVPEGQRRVSIHRSLIVARIQRLFDHFGVMLKP